jgi:hypothetical protein
MRRRMNEVCQSMAYHTERSKNPLRLPDLVSQDRLFFLGFSLLLSPILFQTFLALFQHPQKNQSRAASLSDAFLRVRCEF